MAEEGALPVQDLVYNTTDTKVVLSEMPHNVQMLFVISAYNCQGASSQIVCVINVQGEYNNSGVGRCSSKGVH